MPQVDFPAVESLGGREPSADFVERVPIHFARQHGLLGLAADNGKLPVAVADATAERAWDALQVVARYIGRPVQPPQDRPRPPLAEIAVRFSP